MTTLAQVLTTKLFAPPHRAGLVPRRRLLERMERGAQQRLTLLSAPAGFGKTTLASEWIRGGERPGAWLSLDSQDREPARFVAHLVAALQTVAPDVGLGVVEALQAPKRPPIPWLLTELLNDLAALANDVILVLDDYHAVDAQAIDEVLAYLLDHLPPRLHLVVTTREDPDLRLAGLRARGELTELRAADLRFTPEEAAAFLNASMGLDLSPGDIASLEARTEGWIAGLQLAALSMRGRDDVSGFIASFAGDHRYVVDYLVEEVLRGQPERVRVFLLQTSILERLSGPLCDAVGAREGSDALLDALERGNMFLVPLDETRTWYRYHQLFREVLRAHLEAERGGGVATLHARASAWFEAAGWEAGAVQHALAAGETQRGAALIERAWRAMDSSFRSAAWSAWVEQLPDELVRSRPVLAAGHAWARLNAGEMEAAEHRLREVEAWLGSAEAADVRPGDPGEPPAFVDEAEFRSLPGTVASARAYHALATGDPAASLAHARRALELLPDGDHVGRGIPLGLLSLAQWANGDLEEAHGILDQAMAGFRSVGNVAAAISGAFALADIRATQGRLSEAAHTFEEAFRLVRDQADPAVPGAAELHVGLGEVLLEQGDPEAAERHLRSADALGQHAVLPGDEARLRTAMARLEAGLGNPDRALALLDEADRLRIRSPMPDLRPVSACRARVWLEQGRLAEARAWARDTGPSPEQPPSYLREFEHIVVARVLLAAGRDDRAGRGAVEALALLERLLRAAEDGGRMGSVLEILVLQALALAAQGDARAAAGPLGRALVLAEPEGYVRVFLDEGPPMAALLRDAERRGPGASYARRLRAAPGGERHRAPAAPSSIEALTQREAEVLRLLGTDLSGPEIARELHVSLNTLRTHIKNVYGKLGANSRRTAVRRARDLDLL